MSEQKHTWNHRVIRSKYNNPLSKEIEDYYAIHEVHYTGDKPTMVTNDAITVGGETVEDIKWVLDKMQIAITKPVLDMEYFDNLPEEVLPEITDEDDEDEISFD